MPAEVLFSGPISAGSLDDQALAFPESRPPVSWWLAFACAASVALMGFSCMGYTIYKGIGAWGNNRPVMWAFDIINFVFWIGIGHAGTLISAILLMFRAKWRNAISRFAEAMTIFAVMCAGIFPILHLGRPWVNFWLFPYPNQRGLWPNFRSPLMWDVFAVSTYFSVSLLFWYLGLIRTSSMRDRARLAEDRLHRAEPWLARAATGRTTEGPLPCWPGHRAVLSVHNVVSLASRCLWCLAGTDRLPPYFVVGAIFRVLPWSYWASSWCAPPWAWATS